MKTNLLNSLQGSIAHVPTLVIAMPDLLLAEMISEWQFNCNFRNPRTAFPGAGIEV